MASDRTLDVGFYKLNFKPNRFKTRLFCWIFNKPSGDFNSKFKRTKNILQNIFAADVCADKHLDMLKILSTCIILLLSQNAGAFLLDLNLGLTQGSFDRSGEQTSSKANNALGLFANLSNSESSLGFNIGWYILSVSNKESFPPTINQSLTSNDMGPAIRWQIDRQKRFSLTLAYGIICKGNYDDGIVNENLSGESYLLKFAFEPEIAERYFLGVALNYYVANYKTLVLNSVQSDVAYKNSLFFPSLSFSYRY